MASEGTKDLSAKTVPVGQTYYDTLSLKKQVIYRLVMAGIKHRATRLSLPGTKVEITKAFRAIHRRYLELYYVNFLKCTIKGSSLRLVYLPMAKEEIRRTQEALSDGWEKLSGKFLPGQTPRERYLIIALEIAVKVKCCKTGAYCDYTVAGLADGKGVCEGMSKLFVYFSQKAGLWSQLVLGTLDGKPHSWVAVDLQGTKYYIDITEIQGCPPVYRFFPSLLFKSEKHLRRWGYDFD